MNRQVFALWTLGVGLVVGIIGNALFYGRWIGLSFPFFVILLIVVVLASGLLRRQPVRRRNLWPLAAVLFFAAMIAVRASPALMLLNGAAALALGAAWPLLDALRAQLPQQGSLCYDRVIYDAGF